jgi:hypothetical protein
MPTKEELEDAINQIQTMPASFDNCLKLSTYYNLLNIINSNYNNAYDIQYSSDSEFMQIAPNININRLYEITDEVFSCIQIIAPKLYQSAMDKLKTS